MPGSSLLAPPDRIEGCRNTKRLQHAQDLVGYGGFDAQASERDAAILDALVSYGATAVITRCRLATA